MKMTRVHISVPGEWRFTEKQKLWIRSYFKSAFNSTAAARVAYGGTPSSCRVKGWRKKKRFEAILEVMFNRGLFKVRGAVDLYLTYLENGNPQLLEEIKRRRRQFGSEKSDLWP